jgi:hypothetical protein
MALEARVRDNAAFKRKALTGAAGGITLEAV